MSNGLSSNNVVELLKKERQNIQEQLGTRWDDFVETYCKIINKLPDKPKIEDVERAVDQICELLNEYNYTRELLQSLRDEPTERQINDAPKILGNLVTVDQIVADMRLFPVMTNQPAEAKKQRKENPKGDYS